MSAIEFQTRSVAQPTTFAAALPHSGDRQRDRKNRSQNTRSLFAAHSQSRVTSLKLFGERRNRFRQLTQLLISIFQITAAICNCMFWLKRVNPVCGLTTNTKSFLIMWGQNPHLSQCDLRHHKCFCQMACKSVQQGAMSQTTDRR